MDLENLIGEIRSLTKNKVAIVIDDASDNAASKAMLLRYGGLDTRPLTHINGLQPLLDAIKKEGKEVFLIITDNNLGGGKTGEDLWDEIRDEKFKNIDPKVTMEIHSGGEVDDPDNGRFSKTSPQAVELEPQLKRIRSYLSPAKKPAEPIIDKLLTSAEKRSFEDQLKFAWLASMDPYQAARARGESASHDYYEHDERRHLADVKERMEWKKKYEKLADKAKKLGVPLPSDQSRSR